MKKFVIVGAGTAGAISAAIIKKYWGSEVVISVYYDKSKKIIGVGESTAPGILHFLRSLGLTIEEIIKELPMVTLKMGINFKNWIPNTEYFHGFAEVQAEIGTNTSAIYSIPAGYTGYVYQWDVSSAKSDGNVFLVKRGHNDNGTWKTQDIIHANQNSIERSYKFPIKIEEKSDIEVRAISELNNMKCAATLCILLIQNQSE